jgi:hypothetical protein
LAPEYRTQGKQLGVAVRGGGCRRSGNGQKVFLKMLADGSEKRFDRAQILGVADPAQLPAWARERLAAIRLDTPVTREKPKEREERSGLEQEKMIFFTDSKDATLFAIPDGGYIKITYPLGSGRNTGLLQCRYVDENTVKIDGAVCVMREFAEQMEALGAEYTPELNPEQAALRLQREGRLSRRPAVPNPFLHYADNKQKFLKAMGFVALPDMCYSALPGSGELIIIKKGERGYFRCENSTVDAQYNREYADDVNFRLGVTKAQEAAMFHGALEGWDSRGANPLNYDKNGEALDCPISSGKLARRRTREKPKDREER